MNRRWLLITNCQAIGLGNCINLLLNDIHIDSYNVELYYQQEDEILSNLQLYDHIIVRLDVISSNKVDFNSLKNVTTIPDLRFWGLHPDLSYVAVRGEMVRGPLSDYHSAIVATAYKLGVPLADVRGLFNAQLYDQLGFFNMWETEKALLLSTFSEHGFDILPDFVRWSRGGIFMHSMNHPKIHVVKDFAKHIVTNIVGRIDNDMGFLPHDNLAGGPMFPVYPEIAERLGLRGGSYLFKRHAEYSILDLDALIVGSYATYADYRPEDLEARGPDFEAAMKIYLDSRP